MQALLGLLVLGQCYATHFAFGTMSFEKSRTDPNDFNVRVKAEFAWRWSFPTWRSQLNRFPQIRDKLNVGTIELYEQGLLRQQFAVNPFMVEEINDVFGASSHSDLTWLQGTFSTELSLSKKPWVVSFQGCCRLSTLRNRNNDIDYRVQLGINLLTHRRSPFATGLAREFVQLNQPVFFYIPVEWGEDANGVGTGPGDQPFTWTPKTSSYLVEPIPFTTSYSTGCAGANPPLTCWHLNPFTGYATWTPTATGLYALAITVEDFSPLGPSKIPLDFLMEVQADCSAPGGPLNCAPHFIPRLPDGVDPFSKKCPRCHSGDTRLEDCPQQNECGNKDKETYFYRNIEGEFGIVATDEDKHQTTTVVTSGLPPGARFFLDRREGSTSYYTMRWTPGNDDRSWNVCFQANDNGTPQRASFGRYSVRMEVRDAESLYVSGIVRDFRPSHADFAITTDTGSDFVLDTLDPVTKKPLLNPSASYQPAAFGQWWTSTPGVNVEVVHSLLLSDVDADGSFTLDTALFDPIRKKGWDTATSTTTNQYFTYEIRTFMTYNASMGDPLFEFKSSDDLWVFINDKLPPGWPLGGIHGRREFVVDIRTLGLVDGDNYPINIFFAHRSPDHLPELALEIASNSKCSALNDASSTTEFDMDFATTTAGIATFGLAYVDVDSKSLVLSGNTAYSSASAWYSDGAQGRQVNVFQGFEVTLDFVVPSRAAVNGFALVMQADSQNVRGDPGAGLGYSKIKRALAIEFDMTTDADMGDPARQHVALLMPSLADLANGNVAVSSHHGDHGRIVSGPGIDLQMNNGTVHSVRVQYDPPAPEDTLEEGWLRVWIGQLRTPVVEVLIAAPLLSELFGGSEPYVGLTAGSSDLAAEIHILNFKLNLVGMSGATTHLAPQPLQLPKIAIAGHAFSFLVQSADACGVNLRGGSALEAEQFDIVLVDYFSGVEESPSSVAVASHGDGTYTVTVVITRAAQFSLGIVFQSTDIRGSPFEVTVRPGQTDMTKTKFVKATLPVSKSNAPPGQGVYCASFDSTGSAVAADIFDTTEANNGEISALIAFLEAIPNDLSFACVAVDNAWGHFDTPAVPRSAYTVFEAVGCPGLRSYAPRGSWACIVAASWCGAQKEEAFHATAQTHLTVPCPDVRFDLVAGSGGANAGLFNRLGYINAVDYGSWSPVPTKWVFSVSNTFSPPDADHSVYLVAHDQYDNLADSGTDLFEAVLEPPPAAAQVIVLPIGPFHSSSMAYYAVVFGSSLAGDYDLSVKLSGQTSPKQAITFESGPPSPIFSTVSGPGSRGGQVSEPAQFTILLHDAVKNPVNVNPLSPILYVRAQLTGTQGSQNVSITLTWDAMDQTLDATYTPHVPGMYDLDIFIIDPAVSTQGTEVAFTATRVVQILPGPLSPAHSVLSADSAGSVPLETQIVAGAQAIFYLQMMDAFCNARYDSTPLPLDVSFSGTATHRAHLVKFLGEGLFELLYTPSQTGTLVMQVSSSGSLVATATTPGCAASPLPQPVSGYSITVMHGAASFEANASIVSWEIGEDLQAEAGSEQTVTIFVKDREGNDCDQRDVSTEMTAKLMSPTNPAASSSTTVTATKGCPSSPGVENCYLLTITAERAGSYYLSILDELSFAARVLIVHVSAAPASCALSTPDSRVGDGSRGGITESEASFAMSIKDRFGNLIMATAFPNVPSTQLQVQSSMGDVNVTSQARLVSAEGHLLIQVNFTIPSTAKQFDIVPTLVGTGTDGLGACNTITAIAISSAVSFFVKVDGDPTTPIHDDLASPDGLPPATAAVEYQFCFLNTDGAWFRDDPGQDFVYRARVRCQGPSCRNNVADFATVQNAGDSTQFCGNFTAVTAGLYDLQLFAHGFLVAQQGPGLDIDTLTVTVVAGPAHAPSSLVGTFPMAEVVAGTGASVTVVLKDMNYNLLTLPSLAANLSISALQTGCAPNCVSVPGTLNSSTVLTDGIFRASIPVTQAGSYQVQVLFNGLVVGVNPNQAFRVIPADPNPPSCVLRNTYPNTLANLGPTPNIVDLYLTVPNEPPTFYIIIRDQYLNPVNPFSTMLAMEPSTHQRAGAVYEVTVAKTVADTTPLSFSVSGYPGNCTGVLRLFPSTVQAVHLSPASYVGLPNQNVSFAVFPVDQFNNSVSDLGGTNALSIYVRDPGFVRPSNPMFSEANTTLPVSPLDPPYGWQHGQMDVLGTDTQVAGEYEFSFFRGARELDHVFSFSILPGPIDLARTLVDRFPRSKVGQTDTVEITLHDAWGNTVANSGYELSLLTLGFQTDRDCDHGSANSTQNTTGLLDGGDFNVTFSDLGNGVISMEYTPFVMSPPGFMIFVEYDGAQPECEWLASNRLDVAAGAPSAEDSFIYRVPPTAKAGEKFTVTAVLYDTYGNGILEGGAGNLFSLGVSYDNVAAEPGSWLSQATATAQLHVQDNGDGSYLLGITPLVVGNWTVNLVLPNPATHTYPSSRIPVKEGGHTVDISPGSPTQIKVLPSDENIAARPTRWTLRPRDRLGLLVRDSSLEFRANFTHSRGKGYYSFAGKATADPANGGSYFLDFLSIWAGDFELVLEMRSSAGVPLGTAKTDLTILRSECAARNNDTRFESATATRECVSSYNTPGPCKEKEIRCHLGQECGQTIMSCSCPPGTGMCEQGYCSEQCAAPACPKPCQPSGECYSNNNNCPNPVICAPGYQLCSDGATCRAPDAVCPTPPGPCGLSTSLEHTVQCPNGACVRAVTDCPTQLSCPSRSLFLCSDGSCEAKSSDCPHPRECYDPQPHQCRDGSCRADVDDCPTSVTCPADWLMCAYSLVCVEDRAHCPEKIPADPAMVQCPDGAIRRNQFMCASSLSCPSATPLLCPDGSCIDGTASDCRLPLRCPSNYRTCPGGVCVSEGLPCPTRTQCKVSHPHLCEDGSCQVAADDCPHIWYCPKGTIRCPGGSCVRVGVDNSMALLECPTPTTCDDDHPILCEDGQCAASQSTCTDPARLLCRSGSVRCSGGECVAQRSLCPTHVTCPTTHSKCPDGTCRMQCPPAVRTCDPSLIPCPMAQAGLSCSVDINDCPLAPVCPPSTPTRCWDRSCAAFLSDCPRGPAQDADFGVGVCPGGLFYEEGGACPTLVSCPPSSPFKCFDETCRKSPRDCIFQEPCPPGQFHCASGVCVSVSNLLDSQCQPGYEPCSVTGLVRCPDRTTCKASVADCQAIVNSQIAAPEGLCGAYCANGLCVDEAEQCPGITCPDIRPYLCPEGLCRGHKEECWDQKQGCPPNQSKCGDGSCRNSCPTVPSCSATLSARCRDGTCRTNCDDVWENGCRFGETWCANGECVAKTVASKENLCAATGLFAPPASACPPNVPFRCSSGYCAEASFLCPVIAPACGSTEGVSCASGACVVSIELCPTVKPCVTGTQRCGDASCRSVCSGHNSCPSTHYFRCANGLCAANESTCVDPTTGCPLTMTKCQHGLCVAAGTECPFLPSQGCRDPNYPIRCEIDGNCVASQSECRGANGCPPAARFRCDSFVECVSDPADCKPVLTVGDYCWNASVICDDGVCGSEPEVCMSLRGCPEDNTKRCRDGSCKLLDAVGNAVGSDTCPSAPQVCDFDQVLCANGDCAAAYDYCPPTLEAQEMEEDAPCPESRALMCPDGACVNADDSDQRNCFEDTVATYRTPTFDECPIAWPDRCSDGNCVADKRHCKDPSQCPRFCFGACEYTYGSWQSEDSLWEWKRGWKRTPWVCTDIFSCAHQYRCPSGRCADSLTQCGRVYPDLECKSDFVRAPDGICREKYASWVPYYGCPAEHYQCTDDWQNPLVCKRRKDDCPRTQAVGRTLKATKVIVDEFDALLVKGRPRHCDGDCIRDLQSLKFKFFIYPERTSTLQIAYDEDGKVIASLTIPSGLLQGKDPATKPATMTILPVSKEEYEDAVNTLHPSLVIEEMFGEGVTHLDSKQTLLSTPFRCLVSEGADRTFQVNALLRAEYDANITQRPQDVCLAKLVEMHLSHTTHTRWECLNLDRTLRLEASNVISDGVAQGQISTCGEAEKGLVFAFIHSPVGLKEKQFNLFYHQHASVFIFMLCMAIATPILLILAVIFLWRYKAKSAQQTTAVIEKTDAVDNQEMFGVTDEQDPKVEWTKSPLVLQLENLELTMTQDMLVAARKAREEKEQVIQTLRQGKMHLVEQYNGLLAQLAKVAQDKDAQEYVARKRNFTVSYQHRPNDDLAVAKFASSKVVDAPQTAPGTHAGISQAVNTGLGSVGDSTTVPRRKKMAQ